MPSRAAIDQRFFHIPANASSEVDAPPLVHLGLHYPEAAVVDPKTGIVYITSDRGPCGLFRFVPSVQIFELHLKNNDVQELELVFESTEQAAMGAPTTCAFRPVATT